MLRKRSQMHREDLRRGTIFSASLLTIVGGNCRWSPAKTALGDFRSAAQQSTSMAWHANLEIEQCSPKMRPPKDHHFSLQAPNWRSVNCSPSRYYGGCLSDSRGSQYPLICCDYNLIPSHPSNFPMLRHGPYLACQVRSRFWVTDLSFLPRLRKCCIQTADLKQGNGLGHT